jgi:glycosyltransferase involved in cell wall biosynthesis
MLTVCIPVYNIDVRPLVNALSQQSEISGTVTEILVADDLSDEACRRQNREISRLPLVRYIESGINRGRSSIRNYLAGLAENEYILFLDADSLPPDNQFIRRYRDAMEPGGVVCGGTIYEDRVPDPGAALRWIYGKNREQLTAGQRSAKGFSITANNFMVRKTDLLAHPFREEIRHYGHEDTVFGYDIVKAGLNIRHIDNPVFHTGLEDSGAYLVKTRIALENLLQIAREIVPDREFTDHSGILMTRMMLEKLGLHHVAGMIFKVLKKPAEHHLLGPCPKLSIFDLYRLGYLCSLK